MKKVIAVLAITMSVAAFARGNMNNTPNNGTLRGQSRMAEQVAALTPAQQEEFNALHTKHMDSQRKLMLDQKEVELQIQREMIAETPNQKNINSLIDKKSKIMAEKQKNMVDFRLEAKEKFGMEMGRGMIGGKNCTSGKSSGRAHMGHRG